MLFVSLQEFVRCYEDDAIPVNAKIREYEKKKREQKQNREKERKADPDILFICKRSEKENKLQFYSNDKEKWLKLLQMPIPEESTITIKQETNKGTIMSYHNGEFVISGTEKQRNNFKEWFENEHRNVTEKMKKNLNIEP